MELSVLLAGAVSCSPTDMPAAPERLELLPATVIPTKTVAQGRTLPATYILTASAHLDGPDNGMDYFKAHRFVHEEGVWKGSPTIYWPISGSLSVLCMATEESGAELGSLCTWGSPDASSAVQADIPDGINLDSEILYGASNLRRGSSALHMHHTQACLRFLVSSNAPDLIRIDRIELEDVYSGGVITVRNEGLLHHEWKFSGHQRQKTLTVPGSSGIEVGEDVSEMTLLLPEQRSSNIRISYRRRNYVTDPWDQAPVEKSIVYAPRTDEWQSTGMYEYRLHFKLSEIIFSLSLSDWGHSTTSVSTLH